jgi:hypothetical protein
MNKTISTQIMNIIQEHFNILTSTEQEHITLLLDNIPEPNTYNNKKKVIEKLKELINYLKEKNIKNKTLNKELKTIEETCTISAYFEKDDELQQELIETYSRLGGDDEGILSIHLDLNFEQLKKLSKGVYERTGNIQFFISNESIIKGKIINEITEYPREVPIAQVCTKKDKTELNHKLFLFGEKYDKTKWVVIREVIIPFRFYRFISKENKEHILLMKDELKTGDYEITGTVILLDDYSSITESKKVMMKLPVVFGKKATNTIKSYDNTESFIEKVKELELNRKSFLDYPFSFERINYENGETERVTGHYPSWYKYLIWSWLLHAKKGSMTVYPFHLLIIGDTGTGKTHLLNTLASKLGENESIWDGTASRLKSLVPSFKGNFPKRGYLADTNRFALLDEFFRVLIGVNTDLVEESLACMNALLEHQERKFGSGNGSIKMSMKSRVMCVSNPVRGVRNIPELIKRYDHSFLNRFLFFWQTDDITKLVVENKDEFKSYSKSVSENDFLSLIDFCQGFHAKFKQSLLKEVVDDTRSLFTGDELDLYNSRFLHHAFCLMDGLVKIRCILEGDSDFGAKKRDYDCFKEVWNSIFRSWVTDYSSLMRLPVYARVFYLPEKAKYLFDFLRENPGLNFRGLKDSSVDLVVGDLVTFFEVLRSCKLVFENGEGLLFTYLYKCDEVKV